MIEVMCKECKKKYYILEKAWTEIKICPFCCRSIEKDYKIEINSFESALKQILWKYGYEILKEKRKLVARFMDTCVQYKQEIKIVENFCPDDVLKRIYECRDNIMLLKHEIKIMKSEMISSGIAEKWAETIGNSFYNALSDKGELNTYLPDNFRKLQKILHISQNVVENEVNSVEEITLTEDVKGQLIRNFIEVLKNLSELKMERMDAYKVWDEEKISSFVNKFILEDKIIRKNKGAFIEKKQIN